jgi:hypothetical protein
MDVSRDWVLTLLKYEPHTRSCHSATQANSGLNVLIEQLRGSSRGLNARKSLLTHLRVGVGRCDITPPPGTPQGGWGAQIHQRGLGSDLPLFATALVISDSTTIVAIVDVDTIGFDSSWVAKIINAVCSATSIPAANIRVSYTHTHSGPNTFRLSSSTEGLEMARSYMEGLASRITSAVWQAKNNLRPVRCGAGEGNCEINVNRRLRLNDGRWVIGRNWSGPVDHTVRVIRFDDLDENPVATILHYACHPTTVAWQCQLYTPDYPGIARQVVEQQVGGICLFLQGAAGDVMPKEGFTGDLKVYRRLGTLLGLEASKVLLGIRTLPRSERLHSLIESGTTIALYHDEAIEPPVPELRIRSRTLTLPLRHQADPSELEAEAKKLREETAQLRNDGSQQDISNANARATQLVARAEMARKYYGKSAVEWPLLAILIGDVVLLSMPGEPFTEISQQIVESSPFRHTLFSGYSNGGFGYLPSSTSKSTGSYEVVTSPFNGEAGQIVVDESIKLLRELADEG